MADTFIFSNFAVSVLAAAVSEGDTTFTLMVDDAWRFPTNLGGAKFPIVLQDEDDAPEICYVHTWDPSTGTALVERGREGTAQRAWLSGTFVRHTFTAASFAAAAKITPQGEWDVAESYVPGDLVLLGGISYIAVNANTGENPSGSDDWQPIYVPPGVSTTVLNWQEHWDSATVYAEGAVVQHKGRIWVADGDSTNQEPADASSYWSDIAPWGGGHRYAPILAATGTNNYAANFGSGYTPPALYDGMRVRLIVGNNNTGAATLKIGTLPAIPLRLRRGIALAENDLVSGEVYDFTFFDDNDEFVATATPEMKRRLDAIDAKVVEFDAAIGAAYDEGTYGTLHQRLLNLESRMAAAEANISAEITNRANGDSALSTSITNNYQVTVVATRWVSEAVTTISASEDYDGHPAYLKGLRVNASLGVNLLRRSTLYYVRGSGGVHLTGY